MTISTTAKKLLDAMAFANVNTLGEFRTLLRQLDEPAACQPSQRGAMPPASDNSVSSAIRPIQGAL